MTIERLSLLFLVLVFVMAGIVVRMLASALQGRTRSVSIAVFVAWIVYVGVLGVAGVVAQKTPPGPLFLLLPVALFLFVFLTRHPGIRAFAQRVPAGLLIVLQVFRVCVEVGFLGLYRLHLVPRMLTFEGANVDIVVGLTAPLVAWLYARGKIHAIAVRAWNFIGIAILLNIIVRAVLTTPGPLHILHTEVPNSAFGLFPFCYLPGFLAPLALYLHILSLRSLPSPTPAA